MQQDLSWDQINPDVHAGNSALSLFLDDTGIGRLQYSAAGEVHLTEAVLPPGSRM